MPGSTWMSEERELNAGEYGFVLKRWNPDRTCVELWIAPNGQPFAKTVLNADGNRKQVPLEGD